MSYSYFAALLSNAFKTHAQPWVRAASLPCSGNYGFADARYPAGIQCSIEMSELPENLAVLKDDMVAFIEGHGIRRFPGYVDHEEVQTVMWKPGDDAAEGWKDFVELAKAAGTPFIIMDSWTLEKEELDGIIQRLSSAEFTSDEDLEDARWLRTYLGKTGFVQLGFAFQGVMMLYEAATEWYDHYQRLVEVSEDFGGIAIDGSGADDEL
jgi:hypothetical protein